MRCANVSLTKTTSDAHPFPKISIIVPIYDVEVYLPRCVDSILQQTYTNLEIILIDDGSLDHCGDICDKYAQLDSRIRVVHKENGGLSSARNAGLDIATGDFIGFVDSDDYISPTMYEELYHTLHYTTTMQIWLSATTDM